SHPPSFPTRRSSDLLAGVIHWHGPISPLALSLLLIVFGAGQAMVMAPLYGTALSKVPVAHAGSGGGVISTVQQVGNSCGVVVAGSVFYAVQSDHTAHVALISSLGILILSLLVAMGLIHGMRA